MNPTCRAHPDSDHHDEARELRRMLKEARQKRDNLQEAIADAIFAFDHGRTQDAIDTLRNALDGGGEQS
jgi:hypothetical protein